MSKKISSIVDGAVEANTKVIASTQEEVEKFDVNAKHNEQGMDLCLARDVEFLIKAGICNSQNYPISDKDAKKLLMENVKLVDCTKRCAAIQMGKLVGFANKWGVMGYKYHGNLKLGGFCEAAFPRMEGCIHEAINSEQKPSKVMFERDYYYHKAA